MNLRKVSIVAAALLIMAVSPLFAAHSKKAVTIKVTEANPGPYVDVIKIGSNVEVPKGTTVNSAIAIGGSAAIAGEVIEDVAAIGGSVLLKPSARVHGNVTALGGTVKQQPGAKVAGQIKGGPMPNSLNAVTALSTKVGPTFIFWTTMFMGLLCFLGVLAIGIAAGLIFPKRVGWTAVAIEKHPFQSFLWGVLWLVLALPIAVLLLLSVIGIPLIIVEFVIFGLAVVLGYVAISQVLGKKLLSAFRRYNQPMITEIIWGVVLLTLIGLVPILGAIVYMIVWPMAVGAGWMSRLGEG